MLYNQLLSCLEVKNHVKISFIVLYNQVLSRLKAENHVKLSFTFCEKICPTFQNVVQYNHVLSCLKVENHVKSLSLCTATMF